MSTLDERVTNLEQRIQNLKNEWQVNEKLTVGEVDPKVVIELGKVDGRDVSEDGIVLDDNTNKLGEHDTKLEDHHTKLEDHHTKLEDHQSKIATNTNTIINQLMPHSNNQSNPHGVTLAQIGAAKVNGDTNNDFKSKNLTAAKNLTANELLECKNLKVNNSVDIYHSIYIQNSGAIEGVGTLAAKKLAIDDQRMYEKVIDNDKRLYIQQDLHVSRKLYYGQIFQASSRELKSNISKISSNTANDILMKLNPVKYKFKKDNENEENFGFIAEDVPDILSDKDHKTVKIMDIVAALVKVVQEQQKKIENIESKNA